MKKTCNQYKIKTTGEHTGGFTYRLLMWLRLLVLSFKRQKIIIPIINSHDHDNPQLLKLITRTRTLTQKKLVIIKIINHETS